MAREKAIFHLFVDWERARTQEEMGLGGRKPIADRTLTLFIALWKESVYRHRINNSNIQVNWAENIMVSARREFGWPKLSKKCSAREAYLFTISQGMGSSPGTLV